MRFELRHRFDAPLDKVEAALFADDLPAFLTQHMPHTVVSIEPLEKHEQGSRVTRRVKYVPAPLIKQIGPKQVDPTWMAWIEESTFDRDTHQMEFRNLPCVRQVAELVENRGRLTLRAVGNATDRVVEGELRVKVFLLGKIAEKIIYVQAEKLLDDEARAFSAYLAGKK